MNVCCPHCHSEVLNDGSLAGQTVSCPSCNQYFQMPASYIPQAIPTAFVPRYDSNPSQFHLTGQMKNSGISAVLSFFWTGLGQIYNGQIGKGIVFILLQIVFAVASLLLIGIPFWLALWAWGIYDAYSGAEQFNARLARRRY